jgi:hypothetical protein
VRSTWLVLISTVAAAEPARTPFETLLAHGGRLYTPVELNHVQRCVALHVAPDTFTYTDWDGHVREKLAWQVAYTRAGATIGLTEPYYSSVVEPPDPSWIGNGSIGLLCGGDHPIAFTHDGVRIDTTTLYYSIATCRAALGSGHAYPSRPEFDGGC